MLKGRYRSTTGCRRGSWNVRKALQVSFGIEKPLSHPLCSSTLGCPTTPTSSTGTGMLRKEAIRTVPGLSEESTQLVGACLLRMEASVHSGPAALGKKMNHEGKASSSTASKETLPGTDGKKQSPEMCTVLPLLTRKSGQGKAVNISSSSMTYVC